MSLGSRVILGLTKVNFQTNEMAMLIVAITMTTLTTADDDDDHNGNDDEMHRLRRSQ